MSNGQSKDSKIHTSGTEIKEGEFGSTATSTVDISGDEEDDRHETGDDESTDSSDEDISTLEDQLRKIDLSLEKLQLEYQRDLDVPGAGR